MWCEILILTCSFAATRPEDSGLFVSLPSGDLYGKTMMNYKGEKFRAFEGIPYAQPPVGDLRFVSPKPVEPWEGLLYVNKSGHNCIQFSHFDHKISGNEDCLYLNVYTRMESESNPVIVVVHYGSLLTGGGSPAVYGPEFLLSENVVVVLFNYRLNIFGFLSFDDPKIGVPGNAGFKDMILVLKWIQTNIAEFGGNPDSVTIVGPGTAGSAVDLLMVSPLTFGLFHKAVSQSGSGIQSYPFSNSSFRNVAFILHYDGDFNDQENIFQFIKNKSTYELAMASFIVWNINNNHIDGLSTLGPVIENPEENEDPFLTEHPDVIVNSGNFNQVPYMLGFNTDEGANKLFDYSNIIPILKRDPRFFIPLFLPVKFDDENANEIGLQIKYFYFGEDDTNLENIDAYINFFTDAQFAYKAVKTAKLMAKSSDEPVYFYEFNFQEPLFIKNLGKTVNVSESSHENYFLFKNRLVCIDFVSNLQQRIVLERMIKLWTNFALFGNPTLELDNELLPINWEPVGDGDNLTYLTIGVNMELKSNPIENRIEFWENLLASLSS